MTPPRRVLFVTQSMEGGGAERSICTLLKFLDRSRFAPSLALLGCRGPFLAEVPRDVAIHDLAERSGYDWLGPTRRLRRLMDAQRPNVVAACLRHPNLLSLLAARLARCSPPVVVVEHSPLSRGLATGMARHLKSVLHKWLYPEAAAIVTVSRGVKKDLVKQVGRTAERALIIPNLCDQERILNLAPEAPEHVVDWARPTLVAVGRLEWVKGFDLLLDAVAALRASAAVQLLILGDGPLRPALERQAARLGIAAQVCFLGFRPNPFAYMARARVLVLASRSEGSPNVLVEAMTCGTPVVSVDCPFGPREILQDGAAGVLVPAGSARHLADGIERVLDDARLAAALSAAGKARARAFSASAGARAFEDVLESVTTGVGEAPLGPSGA